MTIVPLASLTIAASNPAKAATVFLAFGAGGCTVVETGVLSSPLSDCADTPIPGFQNGANSLKLTGTSNVFASGGGFGSVTFEMTGSANGGIPTGIIPLSWDFSVGTNRQIGSGSYSLKFKFNSGGFVKSEPSTSLDFNTPCGDFTCANVSGTDQIDLDGPISSYDVTLTIDGFFNSGTFMQINIPDGSIDVNPQAAQVSGTPEPASIALGASGLLGLAFARFRRRRKA